MKRIALLRTRCGCERYLEVAYAGQPFIYLPLRPNIGVCTIQNIPPESAEFKTREFLLDGRTADGIYIYTEVYSE